MCVKERRNATPYKKTLLFCLQFYRLNHSGGGGRCTSQLNLPQLNSETGMTWLTEYWSPSWIVPLRWDLWRVSLWPMVMPITATTVSDALLCVLPEDTADLCFDAGRRSFNLVACVFKVECGEAFYLFDFFGALSLSRFMTRFSISASKYKFLYSLLLHNE
jgi:hypothetical protein